MQPCLARTPREAHLHCQFAVALGHVGHVLFRMRHTEAALRWLSRATAVAMESCRRATDVLTRAAATGASDQTGCEQGADAANDANTEWEEVRSAAFVAELMSLGTTGDVILVSCDA